MGMFDTVIIEGLKLPKLPAEISSYLKKGNANISNDFQTKDLENALQTYTIDEKGQIYLTEYKPTGKKIPYENPFKNWRDNRSLLERLYFKLQDKKLNYKYPALRYIEERKPVKLKAKLTSTFEVYTYEEVSGRYIDVAYEIKAVEGRVLKVTLKRAELEAEKNAKKRKQENLKFDENFAKNIQAQKEFRSKWYYPLLKETYNPFVFFSAKLIQVACNWLIKQTYRWHGV